MSMEASEEMRTSIDLAWNMGEKIEEYFHLADLLEETKPDESIVTDADLAVSDAVIHFFRVTGRNVVSEERGRTAEYGDLNTEYLDPIDGTNDFVKARKFGSYSIAAFSLGSVIKGRIRRGVVQESRRSFKNSSLMTYSELSIIQISKFLSEFIRELV